MTLLRLGVTTFNLPVIKRLSIRILEKSFHVFIAVVTKETPINSAVVNIPQYVMDRALYRVTENIQRFYDVKMGKTRTCWMRKMQVLYLVQKRNSFNFNGRFS